MSSFHTASILILSMLLKKKRNLLWDQLNQFWNFSLWSYIHICRDCVAPVLAILLQFGRNGRGTVHRLAGTLVTCNNSPSSRLAVMIFTCRWSPKSRLFGMRAISISTTDLHTCSCSLFSELAAPSPRWPAAEAAADPASWNNGCSQIHAIASPTSIKIKMIKQTAAKMI
jgi:hypothetical protein